MLFSQTWVSSSEQYVCPALEKEEQKLCSRVDDSVTFFRYTNVIAQLCVVIQITTLTEVDV